jgi:pyruvate/2-oxoglutarate dehydrogenase complex dihydrolipoamide dehydrogenase (E3) component
MMPSMKIEMPRVRARKRKMVDGEIRLHLELYKASGAELIMGEAQFTGPKTVEVKSDDGAVHKFSGDQVVLNLGTHAAIPDVPGLRAARPLTRIEARRAGSNSRTSRLSWRICGAGTLAGHAAVRKPGHDIGTVKTAHRARRS